MNANTLTIDGKRVRYREAGSGTPLVILSGLGLSSRFYEPTLNGLARHGIHAVAPDLPGFGGSRGQFAGISIAEAALWAARFCSAVDLPKAFILGHSIGCQIALRFAADQPHRTLGLILSGPTGARGHRLLHQARALASITTREGTRVVGAVARDYLRTTPVQYVGWWIRAAADRPLEQAARVEAPVLLLIGSDDPVPTPEFLSELIQRLPQAKLSVIAGGLHALPIEQPDLFNEQVAAFVRQIQGPGFGPGFAAQS